MNDVANTPSAKNLRETILGLLPTDDVMNSDTVMRQCYPARGAEVIAVLQELVDEGRVAHLLIRSQSCFRLRTLAEWHGWLAEKSGEQGKLL